MNKAVAFDMKAVVFDLDETILDRSSSLYDFAVWQAKGMLRNSIDDPIVYADRFIELDSNGRVWKDKVYSQLLLDFDITDWTALELLSSYELCFSGFCKPKPKVIEAIQSLFDMGYKLGLVSNGKSPFQERNFRALGISHLFESIVISDAVGYRKPEREIFDIVCNELNISPSNVIFVGDNPIADINGANELGMYTVYVSGLFGLSYEKANANCNDFGDLVDIIINAN